MILTRELPARGKYITLSLLNKDIEAAKHALQAKKDYRYPKVFLQGSFTENIGSAYNTDDLISRHYRKLSLGLTFPLFDRTSHVDEQLARIRLKKAKEAYQKAQQDLDAKASRIRGQRPIILGALQKAKKNIALSQKILDLLFGQNLEGVIQ